MDILLLFLLQTFWRIWRYKARVAVSPLFTVPGSLVPYESLGAGRHRVDAYEQVGDHVCRMLRITHEVAFLRIDRVRQKVTSHFHLGERGFIALDFGRFISDSPKCSFLAFWPCFRLTLYSRSFKRVKIIVLWPHTKTPVAFNRQLQTKRSIIILAHYIICLRWVFTTYLTLPPSFQKAILAVNWNVKIFSLRSTKFLLQLCTPHTNSSSIRKPQKDCARRLYAGTYPALYIYTKLATSPSIRIFTKFPIFFGKIV